MPKVKIWYCENCDWGGAEPRYKDAKPTQDFCTCCKEQYLKVVVLDE